MTWKMEDHLEELGAKDDVLPGRPVAEALHLRDIVIHRVQSNMFCAWKNLGYAAETLAYEELLLKDFWCYDKVTAYCRTLGPRANDIGRVILALSQVLGGMIVFHYGASEIFVDDNGFQHLRQLSWHDKAQAMIARRVCKSDVQLLSTYQDLFQRFCGLYLLKEGMPIRSSVKKSFFLPKESDRLDNVEILLITRRLLRQLCREKFGLGSAHGLRHNK